MYLFFSQELSRPPLACPQQHMHTPYMTNWDECNVKKENAKKKLWLFAHPEPTYTFLKKKVRKEKKRKGQYFEDIPNRIHFLSVLESRKD